MKSQVAIVIGLSFILTSRTLDENWNPYVETPMYSPPPEHIPRQPFDMAGFEHLSLLPLPMTIVHSGRQGFSVYDISDINGRNPWLSATEPIEMLPVFRNPLRFYNTDNREQGGVDTSGIDEERLIEIIEIVATQMGWELTSIDTTSQQWSGAWRITANTRESELDPWLGLFHFPYQLELRVEQGLLTLYLMDDFAVSLPEGYSINDFATREVIEATIEYLIRYLSELLALEMFAFENAIPDVTIMHVLNFDDFETWTLAPWIFPSAFAPIP